MEHRFARGEHDAAVLVPRLRQVRWIPRLRERLAQPVLRRDPGELHQAPVHVLHPQVRTEAHDRIRRAVQHHPQQRLRLRQRTLGSNLARHLVGSHYDPIAIRMRRQIKGTQDPVLVERRGPHRTGATRAKRLDIAREDPQFGHRREQFQQPAPHNFGSRSAIHALSSRVQEAVAQVHHVTVLVTLSIEDEERLLQRVNGLPQPHLLAQQPRRLGPAWGYWANLLHRIHHLRFRGHHTGTPSREGGSNGQGSPDKAIAKTTHRERLTRRRHPGGAVRDRGLAAYRRRRYVRTVTLRRAGSSQPSAALTAPDPRDTSGPGPPRLRVCRVWVTRQVVRAPLAEEGYTVPDTGTQSPKGPPCWFILWRVR